MNYFGTNVKKDVFIEILNDSIEKFKVRVFAWVLMDNHYHLLFDPNNSLAAVIPGKQNVARSDTRQGVTNKIKVLSRFINYLHSITALRVNRLDKVIKRKIWYQYWDYCIRDKVYFYKHLNYIHNNPIKHKKVKKYIELNKYKYSSFNTWVNKKGKEWINSSFENYPIIDFSVEND